MAVLGAALAGSLLVAGCGTPQRTITGAQALQRTDSYLRETLREVPTELKLARSSASADTGSSCVRGMSGSDFTGQVKAEITYTARDVGRGQATRFLRALDRHWSGSWERVDRTPRLHSLRATIDADDGEYKIYANYYDAARELDLGGSSYCVWSKGTPGPGDDP